VLAELDTTLGLAGHRDLAGLHAAVGATRM
jgi:hypothetical protein